MAVKEDELISRKLKVCENCEWCCYSGIDGEFAKCLIDGEQKGLLEQCSKFKEKTGNHFTIYY